MPRLRTLATSLLVLAAGCAANEPAPREGAGASAEAPASARASSEQPPRSSPPLEGFSPRAFAYVVVSVADMEQALSLWRDRFGMEIVQRRRGDDPGLARAWGLAPDAIEDQVLLTTPGLLEGGVHLVRFAAPGEPVREGASPTDLVPKSIDIAVRDIHARHAELTAAGYTFRSKVGTLQARDGIVYEMHMPAHDGLNLVFIEQPAKPHVVSREGYGVAPQIVAITSDNARETAFFVELLGLERLSHNRFSGPEVEKTIGLPKGAALDVWILGVPERRFGRLEFVQYEGVKSRDLYPRAKPPARGMLSVTYIVEDLDPILARGRAHGMRELGRVSSILGEGRMASVTSPSGLRVDLIEQ